jgi:hypothetical protein
MKSKKTKKLPLSLQVFVVLVFLGLVALSTYFYTKLKKQTGGFSETVNTSQKTNLENQESELVWVDYVNEEYGFSFSRPKFLTENKFEDSGDYLSFTRFEGTQFSEARGIGVGVREDSLKDEIMNVKREIDESFDVKLIRESKIKVGGFDAVRLDYEPVEKTELEARSFVILEKDESAISISTHPTQIEKIISSFTFTQPK